MVDFLHQAGDRITSLVGLKYTNMAVHEYQLCRDVESGRFDILWGFDEVLLSALAVGAKGAIGSTFNIAAPLYRRVIESFAAGDLDGARRSQLQAVTMIRALCQFPFHPAMKEVLKMLGTDCGRCRLPQPRLSEGQVAELRQELERIGFFDWARPGDR